MDINYLGNLSFKIKTKTATVLVNPVTTKIEADIVLFTKKGDSTNLEKVVGYKKSISQAGEYEINGVSIMGFKDGENILYVIEADGLRVVHLGVLGKELGSDLVDDIGATDILMVSTSDSFKSVDKIDPYFIIPMGYKTAEELTAFNKAQGYTVERLPKFSLKYEDITEDSHTKIIELETK